MICRALSLPEYPGNSGVFSKLVEEHSDGRHLSFSPTQQASNFTFMSLATILRAQSQSYSNQTLCSSVLFRERSRSGRSGLRFLLDTMMGASRGSGVTAYERVAPSSKIISRLSIKESLLFAQFIQIPKTKNAAMMCLSLLRSITKLRL